MEEGSCCNHQHVLKVCSGWGQRASDCTRQKVEQTWSEEKKVQHLSWHSLSCTAGIESTEFALKVSWQYVHSSMERRAAMSFIPRPRGEEVDLGMRLGHSLKERAWERATTFYLISPRLSICCVHGSAVVPTVKCLARTHWHLQSETIQLVAICKQWTLSKYSRTLLIWTPLGPLNTSWLGNCPHFRGWIVHIYISWDLLEFPN